VKSISTGKQFAEAVCAVFGIDYREHPVMGVDALAEAGAMTEIRIRFAVPYGLMSRIDAEMKKVGAGGTAVTQAVHPDIHPALKPFQAELDAAALAGDIETCKALVLRAGLEWIDDIRKIGAGETENCADACRDFDCENMDDIEEMVLLLKSHASRLRDASDDAMAFATKLDGLYTPIQRLFEKVDDCGAVGGNDGKH
jgi:hypothetical protein